MENYILGKAFRDIDANFIECNHNFEFIAKHMLKLNKVVKSHNSLIALLGVELLVTTAILYIQDKQITNLEKEVERLKVDN